MGADGDQTKRFQWNGIDKALLLWALTDAVCSILLWGTWDEVVGRMGFLYNVLGIYFLLRLWIRDRDDVQRVLRTLAVACVFFAVFMILEQETGRNVFSVFGGVPEFTAIREGKLGPRRHSRIRLWRGRWEPTCFRCLSGFGGRAANPS